MAFQFTKAEEKVKEAPWCLFSSVQMQTCTTAIPHPRPAAEKYKEHLALVACEQLNHLQQSVEQGFTLGKTMVPYTTATGLPSIKGKIGHRGV